MVPVKYARHLIPVALFSLLSGCVSNTGREEEKPVDIYDQLKNNNVQYVTEEQVPESGPEYVRLNMVEARAAYFRKDFVNVTKYCNRTLTVAPATAEAYYWLARIAVDQNDFQQAYTMASKGLTVVKDPNMKAELQRIQTMTQMGSR